MNCPYRAVFQSNSWFTRVLPFGETPFYTDATEHIDRAAFERDVVLVQAQGNSDLPDNRSSAEAWAKNVVSVGGLNHYDTECRDMDTPAGSHGPAADGRIKPDLRFFYDKIFTTTDVISGSYRDDFGGTSGATPMAAGCFGLFFEMWGKPKSPGASTNIFGRTLLDPHAPPDWIVFTNRPHAATTKAMMINTARPYEFVNGISRYNSGWGWPDVRKLYELRDRFPVIIDESVILQEFQEYTTTVHVPAGTPAMKITMVYSDPPGTPMVNPGGSMICPCAPCLRRD
jgi:hypothetical protein